MGILDNIGFNFSLNPLEWFENQENIKAQKEANEKNIELQKQLNKQNLEYNYWAYNKTSEREDTAVQRRMADLQAAGLSPLLAAGSAAAASSPMALSQSAPSVSPVKHKYSDMVSAAAQSRASIAMTNAQIRLLQSQADKAGAEAHQADLQSNLINYSDEQIESLRSSKVANQFWQAAQTEANVQNLQARVENILEDTVLKRFQEQAITSGIGLRSSEQSLNHTRQVNLQLQNQLFGIKEQLMQDQHAINIPAAEKARIDAEFERYVKEMDVARGKSSTWRNICGIFTSIINTGLNSIKAFK